MDTVIKPPSWKEKLFKSKTQLAKVIGIIVLIFWGLSSLAGHSVDRSEVRFGTVKRGNLITQVEGAGTIKVAGLLSFYSPVDSYVKDVFRREGHNVSQGDTILTIDATELDKSILELKNNIRISQNNLKTKEIEFQVLQVNNKKNEELYQTSKEKHEHELNVATRLQKIGASSEGDVLAKKAELKKDIIDLKYLAQTQELQQKKLQQEIETLRLTIEISKNELAFQQNLKRQTVLIASDVGAVSKQSFLGGEKLQKGQLVAQVSNLKDFIVETQISQRQMNHIEVGQKAVIRINNKDYKGVVSLVQPDIKNGYAISEVVFEKGQSLNFKQNQRAQVFVQTGFKENVLLVERGPFLSAGGRTAFKMDGNTAERVAIESGGRNYDLVEIKSGLKEGDKIVISQITSFEDLDEFEIN